MIVRPGGVSRPCVRCGRAPRAGEVYLCLACLRDPKARKELQKIEGLAADYRGQRRVAIERYGWAGGWGRE